ncbi:protein FAM172A [Notothenia coriiceps]|uniref:Protein FAM172A n=1 Tax=Notothenia coriiceps TaxID=8208 RepID=A0A6I9P1P8_9TELE|nr:PREDICTED: protein FAM172A [Notothenia coriiceps]
MKKDEPPFTFPKTLEEFEYAFNEYGQLRHLKSGEPFVFNAREDLHRWNQKRYEALGEIITQYVYELLEKKCNMTKQILPAERTDDEPTSFIYLSPDALSNPSKLLVLIQGSGVVRAGQWARRLIINQDLDSGTQIPFITRAMEVGDTTKEVEAILLYELTNKMNSADSDQIKNAIRSQGQRLGQQEEHMATMQQEVQNLTGNYKHR